MTLLPMDDASTVEVSEGYLLAGGKRHYLQRARIFVSYVNKGRMTNLRVRSNGGDWLFMELKDWPPAANIKAAAEAFNKLVGMEHEQLRLVCDGSSMGANTYTFARKFCGIKGKNRVIHTEAMFKSYLTALVEAGSGSEQSCDTAELIEALQLRLPNWRVTVKSCDDVQQQLNVEMVAHPRTTFHLIGGNDCVHIVRVRYFEGAFQFAIAYKWCRSSPAMTVSEQAADLCMLMHYKLSDPCIL